nr:lipoprotein insertase outer membrane protein LolB [Paracidovorax avenae]
MRAAPLPAMPLRRSLVGALAGCALVLAGCASPPRPPRTAEQAGTRRWNGRMALQVDDPAVNPVSAGFELSGGPQHGELVLLNPLGNVLATLEWSPAGAVLQKGGERRTSPSLDALVLELTGSALPVAALFAWLDGDAVAVPGWTVDTSRLDDGRLTAQRQSPLPEATLRIVLDR